MSEATETPAPRLVKVDILDTINDVIEDLTKQQMEGRELPRQLQVIDMKFELIRQHLLEIGRRAIEIGDAQIQTRLIAIGILVEGPPPQQGVLS